MPRRMNWAPPEEVDPEKKKHDKFAIAGFLYSVLWLLLLFFGVLSRAGAILGGAVGIVLSVIGLKSSKRVTAIMGLILSIACIVLIIVDIILTVMHK